MTKFILSEKLKRTADLDMSDIDTFINRKGTDALLLLHDEILVDNEDDQLELIHTELCNDGIIYIVTDLLDTGWMVDHRFMPDGSVITSTKYR